MLEYDFMRTAFVASGLAAVLAGTVGFFLVLRGQTFAGHALSHVGFTGATGAILFGLSPLAGLVGFTLVAGIGMGLFGEKLAARDVAVGMMLSLALGLGLLFLHFYTAAATQAAALLFGNVLGVDSSALLTLAALAIVSLVALAMIIRPLIFASLESELAEARGVPVRFVSVAFLAIVAVAVAECAQIVGILLVFTLMVGPAAAAQNLSRRLIGGVLLAAGLALAEAWGGLTLAFYTDWPTSFWITALSGLVYLASLVVHFRGPLKRPAFSLASGATPAGGKGGLQPPFHLPSSPGFGKSNGKSHPNSAGQGLRDCVVSQPFLDAIAVDRSTCGGPVDQGFADAGMDDDNPALWNIRHDITPMLVELQVDYPLHRFRAVIRVTYRGLRSFAACASADGRPAVP